MTLDENPNGLSAVPDAPGFAHIAGSDPPPANDDDFDQFAAPPGAAKPVAEAAAVAPTSDDPAAPFGDDEDPDEVIDPPVGAQTPDDDQENDAAGGGDGSEQVAGGDGTFDSFAAAATEPEKPSAEEEDGQFFIWEAGEKVTLGSLVKRGTPVETAWIFGGGRLKGDGAMPAMDEDILLVTRGRATKYALVPTRDDQEKVTRCVIEIHVGAKVTKPADSAEGLQLLAGVLHKHGLHMPIAA